MTLKQLYFIISILFAAIAATWSIYSHFERKENKFENAIKLLHMEQCKLGGDIRVLNTIIGRAKHGNASRNCK